MPFTFNALKRRQFAWLGLLLAFGSAAMAAKPVVTTKVLVVGDSLSAEYGIAAGTGWVALLGKRLVQEKRAVQVVNSSISGETTAGGLSRLPALLTQHKPHVLVIELGANDALRGLALTATRGNLGRMVDMGKQAGAKVLLVGMQLPPNYGKRYGSEFANLFQQVAKDKAIRHVPFLLKGIADRPDARDWFQSDGLHPLSKGHPLMLGNVWPELKPLL
jgi:acyl-CoA thioesterase I